MKHDQTSQILARMFDPLDRVASRLFHFRNRALKKMTILNANAAEREILRNQAIILANQEAIMHMLSDMCMSNYSSARSDGEARMMLVNSSNLAECRGVTNATIKHINQQVNS